MLPEWGLRDNKGNFMQKICESYVAHIKKLITGLNCDYAEIRVAESNTTSIALSGEQIESVSSGLSQGGSIRILNNGMWEFLSFNKIEDIDAYIKKGQGLIQKVQLKSDSGILKSAPIKVHKKTEKQTDFTKLSFDEKFELISSYNKILRKPKQVQTTRAIYKDSDAKLLFINTEGSEVIYDRSHCGAALTAIAKDGNEIQPFHDSVAGFGGYELAKGLESKAEHVAKTAVDLLSAESIEGGSFDVIVDPRLAGVFIHEAFGHLSEADFVYENERMKKIMVLGAKFGNNDLTVIDDGNLDCVGYIPVDDEGVLPEKTYLIKNGVLSGRLHSRETAFKMKENPTGNARAISVMQQPIVRMTNTYIENGPCKTEDIFNSVEDGVYAVNYHGGQTNLEMFTFSSAYGYKIKNGKKGKMYKNIVLSGNVFDTLKKIEMIGNDKKMFGGLGGCGKGGQFPLPVSFGGPHMLIKNVLVGGAQ